MRITNKAKELHDSGSRPGSVRARTFPCQAGARQSSVRSMWFLFALVLATLPGCGPGDGSGTEVGGASSATRSGGVLRVLHEHVRDLDPRIVDDVYESTVVNQVYEGLVRYDPGLGIAPSLAESWIVSEDGLRYLFHVRPGLTFHDGTRLDAAGVVASLERVLAPGRPGDCIAETYALLLPLNEEIAQYVPNELSRLDAVVERLR